VAPSLWLPTARRKVRQVDDALFSQFRVTGVDQAFGSFCFACPEAELNIVPDGGDGQIC
jgi:hypothetical protein